MSSGASKVPNKPEEGDYIINWHLQYCASTFIQGEACLRNVLDQIKAELMKIKTDGEFIKEKLDPPYNHLQRLKSEDKDLRQIIEPINNLIDSFRILAHRAAQRII